ncbi:30S ribosomal protein S18 [Candidatus Uhrbacteria bacterium CG_4_9_14_3_um_filter_41_35]|uniref:Small ribosomal subunit protein bS18 n=1 Tax=Candidatus Uhrbacteria bacterium CG_4_9_14_3_um_filter_41_35 TaxID=1975034 RepID=A0A2M7XGN1_9BACT|nr:MAG: 30S ribosomal protein S18 [Candidatus Uhrbacteria bacterium CG11_big_fil_rev_8_21_14_0_20_41_9]PJA47033.1 MAG: 30S ribosomal protein S18 [Candidatus Uhrbacteria bacterium CG_4_9_14_3_um_filter_41_35]
MAKNNNLLTTDKYCNFCVNQQLDIDYKNTELLKRYISSFAKITSRKRSGLCAKHQRKISLEVKRARIMAFLPFVHK